MQLLLSGHPGILDLRDAGTKEEFVTAEGDHGEDCQDTGGNHEAVAPGIFAASGANLRGGGEGHEMGVAADAVDFAERLAQELVEFAGVA